MIKLAVLEYNTVFSQVNNYLEEIRKYSNKSARRDIKGLITSNEKSLEKIAFIPNALLKVEEYNDAHSTNTKQRDAYVEGIKADRKAMCELVRLAKEPLLEDFNNSEINQYLITEDGVWYFDFNAKSLTKLAFLEGKTPDSLINEFQQLQASKSVITQGFWLITAYTGHALEGALSSEALHANFLSYKNAWDTERAILEALLEMTPPDDTETREQIQKGIDNGDALLARDTAHHDYLQTKRVTREKQAAYTQDVTVYNNKNMTDEQLDSAYQDLRKSKLTELANLNSLLLITPATDSEQRSNLEEGIKCITNALGFDSSLHDFTKNKRELGMRLDAFVEAIDAFNKKTLSESGLQAIGDAYIACLDKEKSTLESLLSFIPTTDEKTRLSIEEQLTNTNSRISTATDTKIDIKVFYAHLIVDKSTDDYDKALTTYLGDGDEAAFICTCEQLSTDCMAELQTIEDSFVDERKSDELESAEPKTGEQTDKEPSANQLKLATLKKNAAFKDFGHQQIILTLLNQAHNKMSQEDLLLLFSRVDEQLKGIVDTTNKSRSFLAKARVAMQVEEYDIAIKSAESLLGMNKKNQPAFLLLIDAHLGHGTDKETILLLHAEHAAAFTDEQDKIINRFYRARVVGDVAELKESFAELSKLTRDPDEQIQARKQGVIAIDEALKAQHRSARIRTGDPAVAELLPIAERAVLFDDIVSRIDQLNASLKPVDEMPCDSQLPLSDTEIPVSDVKKSAADNTETGSTPADNIKAMRDQANLRDKAIQEQVQAEKLAEEIRIAQAAKLKNILENVSRAHLVLDTTLLLLQDDIKKWAMKRFGVSQDQFKVKYNRLNQFVSKGSHWISALIQDKIQAGYDPVAYLRNNGYMSESALTRFEPLLQNRPATGLIQNAHDHLSRYNSLIAAMQLLTILSECTLDLTDFMAEWVKMPESMAKWLKQDKLKHLVSFASPVVRVTAESVNQASTLLLFCLSPDNSNALSLTRKATIAQYC